MALLSSIFEAKQKKLPRSFLRCLERFVLQAVFRQSLGTNQHATGAEEGGSLEQSDRPGGQWLTLVAHAKGQVSVLQSTSLYFVMLLWGWPGVNGKSERGLRLNSNDNFVDGERWGA